MKSNLRIALLLLTGMLVACDGRAAPERVKAERETFSVNSGSDTVAVIEDVRRGVTCWVYDGFKAGGIFCIPNAQLEVQP